MEFVKSVRNSVCFTLCEELLLILLFGISELFEDAKIWLPLGIMKLDWPH